MSKSFTDSMPGRRARACGLGGLLGAALFAAAAVAAPAPVTGSGDTAAILARLDQMERLLEGKGLLDMLQQIEALQREVKQLRGQVEVQTHEIEQLRKRQRDLYADIDQRLQRLNPAAASASGPAGTPPLQTLSAVPDTAPTAEDSPDQSALTVELVDSSASRPSSATEPPGMSSPTAATTKPATQTAAAAAPAPAPAPAADPAIAGTPPASDPVQARAQYEQAFKLLKDSRYDQAIKAFRDFLAVHPGSEFSDNAQYWLAETYYVNRNYQQALEEYEKLVRTYPQSQKLTHALLKIGYSYHEMGRLDEARAQLEGLIKQYPGTTAARLADDRLKKISTATRSAPSGN